MGQMNQVNRNIIDKRREKAKELLEISLKLHNELRPNMNLESNNKSWGKLTCQQVQENIENIFQGSEIEADMAAQAIVHIANCEKCLEVLDILIWE